MGLFTGIGDFFRGAFGEDDEEKRRRKERERQAAQARAIQNKPKPQPKPFNQQNTQQSKTVQDLFGKKPIADPLGVTKTKLFQQQPKAVPPPTLRVEAPRPQPTVKVDTTPQKQDITLPDGTKLSEKPKTLVDYVDEGLNAGKSWEQISRETGVALDKVKAYSEATRPNYGKKKPEYSKGIGGFFEKAGDKLEANSPQDKWKRGENLQAENYDGTKFWQKGRDFAVSAGREFARVPETVFLSVDKNMDETAANDIEKALAEKDPQKRKELVKKITDPKGAWFQLGRTKTLNENMTDEELIALRDDLRSNQAAAPKYDSGVKRFLYGSDPVQSYQQRFRGMREEFKKGESAANKYLEGKGEGGQELSSNITRNASTIALILAALGVAGDVAPDPSDLIKGGGKKIGKELIEDTAKSSSDEIGSAITKAAVKEGEQAIIEGTTKNLADDAAQEILQSAEKQVDDTLSNLTDEELKNLADDVEAPAYQRTEYKAELERRAKAADEQLVKDLGVADTPVDTTPAYVHKQQIRDIYNNEIENLNRYVNENPQLTRQEIESARQLTEDRVIKLVEDLQKSRYASDEAVTAQAKATDEVVQGQQAVNADVAAQKAAQTAPDPQDVVEGKPVAGSPEVAANDAYRASNEEILFPESPEYAGRDGLNILQKISPDRIIRENVTRPLENMVNRVIASAQTSKIAPVRGVGRLFTGFSRELGIDPALQTARMQMRGSVEYGKLIRENIADLSKGITPESRTKIWANLDPEQAGRLGIEGGRLSPAELVIHDKLKALIDNTTSENLRRGLITPEQASAGYIKRAYSVYDGNTDGLTKFEQSFRQELLGQYKGRKTVSDEMVETAITDPTYLVGKKSAESQAMWAMQDYGNYLHGKGLTLDVPQKGYTQLPDSKVFGEAAGKWVPRNVAEDFTGFQYNNAMVSALSDVMNVYDRWGVRQAKKQLLTIFNPAVRLGNQVSNRAIFSQLNGVNPVQFNKVFYEVAKMADEGHPLYREAIQQGLTGVDITQAEFYAKRIAESTGDKNLAKKAVEGLQNSYSKADDQARIAAYVIHRERGYAPEEAARLVQRGFQDYKSVGFFYDMAAKTPIVGNAFVRFVADSIRIAKNAAIDHPLRTAGTLALWAAFANGMSIVSGEGRGDVDEQGNDVSSSVKGDNLAEKAFSLVTGSSKGADQKAREGRFGAPMIPFTNISMTTQTPWGEINAARFMPWYSLNDINDGLQKFLPISQSPITIKDGKPEVNGAGFADPLLGQLFQMGFDKDFRNKSIQDPDNTGQLNRDPLTTEEKLKNVARFFGVNNAPLGREADAIISAKMGVDDLYGKTRTMPQALLRSMGIKTETYGDEQIADQKATESYFAERDRIEQELKGMSPEAQAAYKRLTGYDKLREMVPNEFAPGEMRNKKYPVYDFPEDKWKDYSTHPELYKLMQDKKVNQARELGKQVQPEFDPRLSESFRKQLIENKIVAPGDDAELDQRMYSSPEWDYYQSLKKSYKTQFKDEEYTDELVKHKTADFPEKPDILKQYGAQYGLYTQGKAEKPEFTDALKAAKEAYNKQTFDWTNKEREARGLPAIVWDMWNNPTFGYDETPASGFGYGFGGGGGSNRPYQVNNMGRLTNYSDSVKRLDAMTPQEMANLSQFFGKLQGQGGGGRQKPKIGASSTGI